MLEDFGGFLVSCHFLLRQVELKSLGRRLKKVVGVVGNLLADRYRGNSNWNLQNWGPSGFTCFFKTNQLGSPETMRPKLPVAQEDIEEPPLVVPGGKFCVLLSKRSTKWCTLRVTVTGFTGVFWGLFGRTMRIHMAWVCFDLWRSLL